MGISSRLRDYDADTVKHNLLNNLPVIIAASDWLIPLNHRSHCFVIDGYKTEILETTYYHYWVAGIMDLDPDIYEPYYTYQYTNYGITAIRINWGWESQWLLDYNNGWFGLTADWYVDDGTNQYDFNHNVRMIYGFHL